MEMRQLEMLSAVVEATTYLGAGESMHISHTAIHRQIRLLEMELGHKLLVRSGTAMHLTDAGRILLGLTEKVKQDVQSLTQAINDLQGLTGGELRVGTGSSVLILFLPTALEEFHDRYPGVRLRIITGTAEQIVDGLRRGTLDVGLIREPSEDWPASKDLSYEHLYEEEYSLAVSKEHSLAAKAAIAWSELKDVPIITFPSYSRVRRLIDRCFEQADITPDIIMELENEEAIEKMIDLSLGAGFVATRRILCDRLCRVMMKDQHILLSIVGVHNKSYVPRRVEEFLNICRHHALSKH